jgi:hypothetical protein
MNFHDTGRRLRSEGARKSEYGFDEKEDIDGRP